MLPLLSGDMSDMTRLSSRLSGRKGWYQGFPLLPIRGCCLTFFPSLPLFFFISVSIVLLQVPRRRPLFLLPLSGVHLNAVRAMLSRSIFITCPSHLHLLCFVTVVMFLWWSFLFEIIWGLYILHIVLRHEVWKPDNLWLSLWVPLQHSAPYSSILIRRCCNRSLFFFSLMLGDLHTLFSWTNDDLAFWRQLEMSSNVELIMVYQ